MKELKFGDGNILITQIVTQLENGNKVGEIVLQEGNGTGKVGEKIPTKDFKKTENDMVLSFKNIESLRLLINQLVDLDKMVNGTYEGKLTRYKE